MDFYLFFIKCRRVYLNNFHQARCFLASSDADLRGVQLREGAKPGNKTVEDRPARGF